MDGSNLYKPGAWREEGRQAKRGKQRKGEVEDRRREEEEEEEEGRGGEGGGGGGDGRRRRRRRRRGWEEEEEEEEEEDRREWHTKKAGCTGFNTSQSTISQLGI